MPLTLRTNGTGAANLITASWFNDFYNVLTGAMTDQPVKIANSVATKAAFGPSAPTLALAAGTNLGIGNYTYSVTFVDSNGAESSPSSNGSITTTSGNQKVTVTIPTGGSYISSRNIYRSKVGGGQQYLLHTVADNTTTSYSDSATDASLPTTLVPLFGSAGGIRFIDPSNFEQGFISAAGGGYLGFGIDTALDFEVPQGTSTVKIDSTGLHIGTNKTTPSVILVGNSLGVKTEGGTKLFEAKNSGNFIIGGAYQTTGGTSTIATGQSFDSFDVAEVFECDKAYPRGTVVCPGEGDKLTLCTHENCHAAMVVSYAPGLGFGVHDHEQAVHYIALAGRVNIRTAQDIPPRALVVSDGRGGVRMARSGEPAFVIGFALNSTAATETVVVDAEGNETKSSAPMVGVMLRSMFVVLGKGHS